MENHERWGVYESVVPYEDARIQAAAVYCSDGRLGDQCDDFLHNALGLPRYDRVAVPGGPACLAGHFAAYREEDAVKAQLEFLISAHQLQRVVLIAHQDCAFYTAFLDVSSVGLAEQQREDLLKAAARVRELGRSLAVEAYFAAFQASVITFEPVTA
ncbi:MAG: carbonic anhydrase [Planctomycetota bacterium]|jgi:hypothetical protein